MEIYDVIVVGGGVSGAISAIASARYGAKTLIVEKMGFLGGMLTAGGVGPMMTFHAGNIQVVQGIAEEVIQRLRDIGGSPGHIIDTTGYTYTVTPFDAELLKHVLESMFIEAGGKLLYHSMLSSVVTTECKIESIIVATKSGSITLKSEIFIDATGDGDLAAWSGVEFLLGRDQDNLCQPVTMNFKVSGVDIDKIKAAAIKDPQDFPNTDVNLFDKSPRLSMGGFEKLFKKGREDGEITFSREYMLFFETNNLGELIVNTTRLQKINPTDAWDLTKAEVECRRQVLELFRFMKKRLPGFENSILLSSGPNIGIRESRKIKGKYILNSKDLINCVKFEDEIACGGYPVDIHSPNGEGTDSEHLKWGDIYGIPFRSLINEKIENLINVGRCISVTHEACAGIRVSPIAMSIGEVGGTAAGICIKNNYELKQLDSKDLRLELKKNGAYIR